MKHEIMTEILQKMMPYLNNVQTKQLQQVLEYTLFQYEIVENATMKEEDDTSDLIMAFIAAKRIEGCSEKTLPKVHPHKFRRTLATMAIDKGMPIEQLQRLLGHKKIDTTLQYAMVKQSNVKIAHRKYIG